MAGGGARFEGALAEADRIAVGELKIGAGDAGHRGHGDPGAGSLAQQPRAGNVIGVHVGLEHVAKVEAEVVEQPQVAVDLLAHRIDERGVFAVLVGQQVGVRGRFCVE